MSEERLICVKGSIKSLGAVLKELEKKYNISIDPKENLFYVYGYFGGLLFIADSIPTIEKEMNKIYKTKKKLEAK